MELNAEDKIILSLEVIFLDVKPPAKEGKPLKFFIYFIEVRYILKFKLFHNRHYVQPAWDLIHVPDYLYDRVVKHKDLTRVRKRAGTDLSGGRIFLWYSRFSHRCR